MAAWKPGGEAGGRGARGLGAWVQSKVSQIVDKLGERNRQHPSRRTFHPANLLLARSQVAAAPPVALASGVLSPGSCPQHAAATPGEGLRPERPGRAPGSHGLFRNGHRAQAEARTRAGWPNPTSLLRSPEALSPVGTWSGRPGTCL